MRRGCAVAMVALVGVSVLAACGDDDDDGATADTAAATSAAEAAPADTSSEAGTTAPPDTSSDATTAPPDTSGDATDATGGTGGTAAGEPIVFAQTCLESPPIVLNECYQVVEAVFAQYNAAGGLDGRPLEVEHCDSNSTVPELLPACLTRFTTDDRYIGFVGNIQDQGIDAAAAPLSMANIGPVGLVIDDFVSDISFPWSGWAAYAFAPVALYGAEQDAVTPAVLYPQIEAGEQSLQAIAQTYAALGVEPIAIPAALNEPSFAPMVTRAQAENGNPLFIQQAAVQVAQVIGEARAIGYEPIFAVPFTFHDVAFSEAAGSDANGAVGALPYTLDDIGELEAVMDEFGPDDWNLSYAAVNSYVAADHGHPGAASHRRRSHPRVVARGTGDGDVRPALRPRVDQLLRARAGRGHPACRLGEVPHLRVPGRRAHPDHDRAH